MSSSAFCSIFEITDEFREKQRIGTQKRWDSYTPEERDAKIALFISNAPDNKGQKKSDEFKKRRSEYMKAAMMDPSGPYVEFKKKNGERLANINKARVGTPLLDKQKEKISAAIKDFYQTPAGLEHKAYLALKCKELRKNRTAPHPMQGKKHSQETKRKLSETNSKFLYTRSDGETYSSLRECASPLNVTIQCINYCIKNNALCKGKYFFKRVSKNEVLGE